MEKTPQHPWPPAYRRNLRRKKAYSFAALLWGSRGDVQPFIALSAELVRRGHRAVVAAREPYRKLAEEQGVDFFTMPDDGTEAFMQAMARAKGIPDMLPLSASYSRKLLPAQFKFFEKAGRGADVILTKAVSTMPALHIAERRGLPVFQAHIDPGFIPGEDYCMAGDQFKDMGVRLNRFMPRFMQMIFALTVADRINAWRRKHGMPPDRLARRNWAGSLFRFPTFMVWSPHFLPRSADWPDWYVQTGWWRLPRKKAPRRRLGDFVLSGPPPLYIGFGSWDIHDKAPVTDAVLEALRITRNRAVLLSATVDRRPDYPPNVFVADSIPHEWLFPRLKAAVHHGGAGTTGAVSMAGIPSVIVPAFDAQKTWGHLVGQKGIGTMLDRRELNAETLAAAIREVEQEAVREQARRTGVLLRDERGVEQAADEVERHLWEATKKTASQQALKLTEVHPVFTSGKYIEDLPSPDPLERGRVAGGDAAADEPAEEA